MLGGSYLANPISKWPRPTTTPTTPLPTCITSTVTPPSNLETPCNLRGIYGGSICVAFRSACNQCQSRRILVGNPSFSTSLRVLGSKVWPISQIKKLRCRIFRVLPFLSPLQMCPSVQPAVFVTHSSRSRSCCTCMLVRRLQ